MTVSIRFPRAAEMFSALPPSTHVDALSLTAGAAETFTVPSGALFVVFSATGNFYARYGATATVPGDTSDGSASELNPTIRKLVDANGAAITSISVIAPADAVVTAAYYLAHG